MRPGGRASAPNFILTAAFAVAGALGALGTSGCGLPAEAEGDAAVITDDGGSTSQLRGSQLGNGGSAGAGGDYGGLGQSGGAGGERRTGTGGATVGAAGAGGTGGVASPGGAAGMGRPPIATGGAIGSGGMSVVMATGGMPAVTGSGGVVAGSGGTGTGGLPGSGGVTATGGTANNAGTGGAPSSGTTGGAAGSADGAGTGGAAGMADGVGGGAGSSGAAGEPGGGAAGEPGSGAAGEPGGGAGGEPGAGGGASGQAGAGGGEEEPPQLVDAVTLSSVGDLERRRQALRQVIWGQPDLPSSKAVVVGPTENCPLDAVAGADSVTELRTPMEEDEEGLACHYVPPTSNHRLVIYNPGHFCTVSDGSTMNSDGWPGYGDQRTVESLLAEGYSVLVTYMPHFRPDDCWFGTWDDPHALMFRDLRPRAGSAWKYFLEPIVASLNTLEEQAAAEETPHYTQVDMLGLSGGGWTTVAMSAIDTRIKVSIHVAGTEPLEFWGWQGADEQTRPELYRVAAYRDLYILGAAGEGRHQLHLLNRYDNCCFFPGWSGMTSASWEEALRSSAAGVNDRLSSLGFADAYRLHIDDTAVTHQISRVAIANIILPELAMHAVGP